MNGLIRKKLNELNDLYLKFKNFNYKIFQKKNDNFYKKLKIIDLLCNEITCLNIIEKEIISLYDLLDNKEFFDLAKEELKKKNDKKIKIESNIFNLFTKKYRNKNCILEIRAGIGGLESCYFIKDLYNLYIKYANLNYWKSEILNYSIENNVYKYIIFKISGEDAFSKLRFESGCHRVQRVPLTEHQGRIHTSTCLVVVLPESVFKKLPDLDLTNIRIDTFKSSGAGGQHVNTTDSAVRIKHIPTGMVVECQDERSQHKNKEKALNILKIRLKNYEESKIKLDLNLKKKKILDYGDRSFKNRTYNYIQDRVTDHRINASFSLIHLIENGNLNLIHEKLFETDIVNNLDIYIDFILDLIENFEIIKNE